MRTDLCARATTSTVVMAVALIAASSARSNAQAPSRPIPIRSVTAIVESSEPFLASPSIRPLPGDRLLVNDQRGKRLIVFDSAMKSFTIMADSAGTTATPYPNVALVNPLVRFVGDSSIMMDFESRAFIVIDPDGKMARPMAPVKAGDLMFGSRPWSGKSASDKLGRVIFTGSVTRPQAKPGDPPITDTRDTISIVRADFNNRTTDTIGFFSVPRTPETVFGTTNGKPSATSTINAGLSGPDEFAVLSDGTLAIVREHDYVVDWVDADGKKSSTGKLPFEWVRQTDAMKQARIDSMKHVIDSMSAAGTPYGRIFRSSRSSDGSNVRRDTIIPTIVFTPLGTMADYPTPFRRGQILTDENNNVWVLPTATSLAKGGLLYDVINRKDGLHERVQVPGEYLVVGFGQGDVVYLAKVNAGTKMWTLARATVVRRKL